MTEPVYHDQWLTLYGGDAATVLSHLPSGSVQTVVTSPPYWGLRDYGVDGQLGLEDSPTAYVTRLVALMDEVRRVLADDGTLWLNLGDSYAAQRGGTDYPPETIANGSTRGRPGGPADHEIAGKMLHRLGHRDAEAIGLKHKDMVGIPWRVAFALQEAGWYLRSDIIWAKPNPMPESVEDRPTKSHEYVFLLSKSERYYYDFEAVREPLISTPEQYLRAGKSVRENHAYGAVGGTPLGGKSFSQVPNGRNMRTVWTIATQPYPGAHFAVFPEALVEPCIKAGSRPGDMILDPFGGTGTVGVVAQRLSRRATLIDLNPDYLKQCLLRNHAIPLGL